VFQIKRSFCHNTKFKNAVDDALGDIVDSGILVTQLVKASNGKNKTIHSVASMAARHSCAVG